MCCRVLAGVARQQRLAKIVLLEQERDAAVEMGESGSMLAMVP